VCVLSGELYEKYVFLEKVLSRDFVFQPHHTRPVFDVGFILRDVKRSAVYHSNLVTAAADHHGVIYPLAP